MTTDLLEWTPADSKALDAYARSHPRPAHHSNETHTSPNSSQHSPGQADASESTSDNPAENAEPPWHPEPDASKATPHTAHEDAADPATTAHATASEDTVTEHWFIPRHQQQELTDALAEVRDILDDLREAQKPRIATANWNPKVTTGDRPQPLPFNVAAVDAADRLLICLETWAWFLADARGITAVHATCSGYADWLTRNILLLAATKGSEAAHHDITTEIRHARNASGRSHLQPIPKPNPQRLAQAHAEQLNARGIATLAKHIGAQGLTIRRIKHLRETGKIVPVRYADKRTPIYQLGDVLNAHYATSTRKQPA